MDDSSSGRASIADSVSLASASLQSANSSQNIPNDDGFIHVYTYKKGAFENFSPTLLSEEICTRICRELGIQPAAQLLFGICEYSNSSARSSIGVYQKWKLPGEHLFCDVRYCFRMRFRVPELDRQLSIDIHNYLYYQMRFDMLHEQIPEIRYPEHKDEVLGMAVMDMAVDKQERHLSSRDVEKAYKRYLPRSLWRAHRFFVRSKIRSTFRPLISNNTNADNLKWHYVHQIYNLAPTYLTEQFKAYVEYFPNESTTEPPHGNGSLGGSTRTLTNTLVTASQTTLSTTVTGNGNQCSDSFSDTHMLRFYQNRRRRPPQQTSNSIPVFVRLWPHDSSEPGLKVVARVKSEATLNWSLVAVVEDIFSLYKESEHVVRLEIVGFPKGYHMRFETEHEIKSFISYLGIYTRLTVKWMQDLCPTYKTPSLVELELLYCHGPIGGGYSFMKLHENGDKCGNYIVRQCDREYDTYYIDINTRIIESNSPHTRCQTETFKIIRGRQWKLQYNGVHCFENLPDLAKFIRTDSAERIRIPASKYDKPPLLLLCLPRNLATKKTEAELSDADLQRRNPQIFNPKTDLQWYRESISQSDDDKVFTMRGDWLQQGSFKDVPVTMKMLKIGANFQEFMKLAHTWSLIQSPQFIKLYGLTLSEPYTMVMEHSEFSLTQFLKKYPYPKTSMYCLLDMMHGLVRGMHYLEDNKIIHSHIRCSNLYVTKYDFDKYVLDAKIGDPGYPRAYKQSDSPWIPIQYFNNLEAAKKDPSTQLWSFATTTYEIFSGGQEQLDQKSQRELIVNRTNYGGILKPLSQQKCPAEIYNIIMDGWSDDPAKRFSHHDIFTRLNDVKTHLQRNYDMPRTDAESFEYADDCTEYSSHNDDNGHDQASKGEGSTSINGHGMPNGQDHPTNSASSSMYDGLSKEFFANSNDLPLVMQLNDCKVIYREKNKIGQGHYGTVYRGEIEYYDKNRSKEHVAIKKLKSVQLKDDFYRETDIMRKLDHPNVVKFKYWASKSMCIIMEFIEFGSFLVYLNAHKPILTDNRLLHFARDIALGMEYLSNQGLIHRDLAARNILVDQSCVKISDFGLTQFANADGYYIGISQREIPIEWYSPEAIATLKFSSYSDVWSFGVTLYEMFSRGAKPILPSEEPLTQDMFLNQLREGKRLPKPELCSNFAYNELMLPCWHEKPKMRPTFSQIIKIILSQIGDNVAGSTVAQQQLQQQQQMQLPLQQRSLTLEDE